MSIRLLVLCLDLAIVGTAPATGIQLVGGCDTPGEAFSVAVNGNYAYVADGDSGLRVISVSDPSNPVEVGHCETPGWAHGVAVSGDYVSVADYDSGLWVVSVADPAHPVIVGHCDVPGKAASVSLSGDYACVAGSDSGLRVLSLVDPTHPIEVGHCDVAGSANAVATSEDMVYVGDSYGLTVVSAADATHPHTVDGYLLNAPVLAVAVAASRACVTVKHEAMHVFSVGDSERIAHLGQYGYYYWARGSAIGREYEYVAADEDGLRVISIADPAHPVEVAFYDMPEQWANGVSVVGGYVYVAYGMAGLQIFQGLDGIQESAMPQGTGNRPAASVVRHLPAGATVFDALGRRVSRPKQGVYFAQEIQAHVVTKIVITR
jgi:hypothetical protein